jgi:hypothetical protein
MDNQEKPKRKRRKHSPETIALMRERRRARTKQPREGQSKKRKNIYEELKHEYNEMKARTPREKKQKEEALKWLEENKSWLNDSAQESRERGIHCEYHEMYFREYEYKVGHIIYDNEDVKNHGQDASDPYNMVEGYEQDLNFGGGDFDDE